MYTKNQHATHPIELQSEAVYFPPCQPCWSRFLEFSGKYLKCVLNLWSKCRTRQSVSKTEIQRKLKHVSLCWSNIYSVRLTPEQVHYRPPQLSHLYILTLPLLSSAFRSWLGIPLIRMSRRTLRSSSSSASREALNSVVTKGTFCKSISRVLYLVVVATVAADLCWRVLLWKQRGHKCNNRIQTHFNDAHIETKC